MTLLNLIQPVNMDIAILMMPKRIGLRLDGMALNLEKLTSDSSTLPPLKVKGVQTTGLFADLTLMMLIFQRSTESLKSLKDQFATPLRP